MNRTERLLDLVAYLLNAQEPVSWRQIRNHFPEDYAAGMEESSQRKFERDKAELVSLGIPIDYRSSAESKKEGYIIEKEKLFLPEIQFKPQESSLLMLAASAVREHESFPYREQLESALLKIISMQNTFTPPPAAINITYFDRLKQSARPRWIKDIQDALERRKTIEIVYHAFTRGQTRKRKVNPYGLIFRRRSWILVGWDHLRRDMRSFVLTRILELKVNPRRPGTADYEIPEDFSLKRYRDQQPWEYGFHEPIEVTIEVAGHRLPELLPQLATAERLKERVFRLQVSYREGLIGWVLSEKTDVRVLEPPEIQQRIREVVAKLL